MERKSDSPMFYRGYVPRDLTCSSCDWQLPFPFKFSQCFRFPFKVGFVFPFLNCELVRVKNIASNEAVLNTYRHENIPFGNLDFAYDDPTSQCIR